MRRSPSVLDIPVEACHRAALRADPLAGHDDGEKKARRHCERKRSNPGPRRRLWIASSLTLLAMTWIGHTFPFSRRISPELCIVRRPLQNRGRREGRVAAAPGAPAQKVFAQAREPQVQAVTTGLPCPVDYGL